MTVKAYPSWQADKQVFTTEKEKQAKPLNKNQMASSVYKLIIIWVKATYAAKYQKREKEYVAKVNEKC